MGAWILTDNHAFTICCVRSFGHPICLCSIHLGLSFCLFKLIFSCLFYFLLSIIFSLFSFWSFHRMHGCIYSDIPNILKYIVGPNFYSIYTYLIHTHLCMTATSQMYTQIVRALGVESGCGVPAITSQVKMFLLF